MCNYNGVTQSDLNRHKKTQSHIARSQNVCTMCGLGFYSSSQKQASCLFYPIQRWKPGVRWTKINYSFPQVHIAKCHPEMEGASSLIQMSLGLPPSQDPPNIFLGPSFEGSSAVNATGIIMESPQSVNDTLNGFTNKGMFLAQLPNEPQLSPSQQPTTSSSEGSLEIDLSEGWLVFRGKRFDWKSRRLLAELRMCLINTWGEGWRYPMKPADEEQMLIRLSKSLHRSMI